MRSLSIGMILVTALTAMPRTRAVSGGESGSMKRVKHLKDFRVIEFRRYTVKRGERDHFVRYFESYFPEAFEQLGAIAFGQFLERRNGGGFTWIRGFPDMDSHAAASKAFYAK
jgi:hypothetical protein